MKIWGIHKTYKTMSWWANFMGGHLNIGPITIYGANAMGWAVNIQTKRWGYVCFTLPVAARWRSYGDGKGKYFHWYFYVSPNATPWASTFYRGSDENEVIRAQIRKLNLGHNFEPWYNEKNRQKLRYINDKFDYLRVSEYELQH